MDQKPLTSIFNKHLVDVSPRIRRIAMRSWTYMFTTQWIAGKDNSIADRLSRVSPTPIELIRSEINLPIYQVNILKATGRKKMSRSYNVKQHQIQNSKQLHKL